MAAGEELPTFEKLRIDNSTPKSVVSPFHSIKDKDYDYEGGTTLVAPALASHDSLLTSSIVSQPERELNFTDSHTPGGTQILYGTQYDQKFIAKDALDDAAIAVSLYNDSRTAPPVRKRNTSVSFDPKKTLDNGHQLSLEEPLPRPIQIDIPAYTSAKPCSVEENENAISVRASSETGKIKVNPFTGEVLAPRRQRRHGRLKENNQLHYQNEQNYNGADHRVQGHDPPASLPSGLTRLVIDETSTFFGNAENFVASPPQATSPLHLSYQGESANVWPFSRDFSVQSVPQRSGTLSSSGSLRRNARKASARSAPSTMSPAGAFLSQWVKDEPGVVAQPDDEGQEIGDHSEYIIGRQIGYGGFSVVKEAFTIEGDIKIRRAVKIVRKYVNGKSEFENEKLQAEFEHEVSIWRFLRHRYILPLIAVYDSPFATFCITQYIAGGTLFDLVRDARKSGGASSSLSGMYENNDSSILKCRGIPGHLARRYAYQLASALRYLHEDVHVVHRDIKLENCLLDMTGPEADAEGGNVLLCDFGMADFVNNDSRPSPPLSPSPTTSLPPSPREATSIPPYADISAMHNQSDPVQRKENVHPHLHDSHEKQQQQQHSNTFPTAAPHRPCYRPGHGSFSTSASVVVGSLAYASPESISCPRPIFWPVVDIWAYGVVTHALLVGSLPFAHAFEPKLLTMILKGDWDEEALRVAKIDDMAVEVLRGCLQTDAEQRWTIREVLEAFWFDGCKEMLNDFEGVGAW